MFNLLCLVHGSICLNWPELEEYLRLICSVFYILGIAFRDLPVSHFAFIDFNCVVRCKSTLNEAKYVERLAREVDLIVTALCPVGSLLLQRVFS